MDIFMQHDVQELSRVVSCVIIYLFNFRCSIHTEIPQWQLCDRLIYYFYFAFTTYLIL